MMTTTTATTTTTTTSKTKVKCVSVSVGTTPSQMRTTQFPGKFLLCFCLLHHSPFSILPFLPPTPSLMYHGKPDLHCHQTDDSWQSIMWIKIVVMPIECTTDLHVVTHQPYVM